MYQYKKLIWIVILLVLIITKTKSVGYIAWVLVFSYLLLDDALQLHELIGDRIGVGLDLRPYLGLRPQDFGQLIFATIVAGIVLLSLAFFYIRGSSRFRHVRGNLLLLIVAFGFFAVVLDAAHGVIHVGIPGFLLGIAEEGGEMLIISLIAGYVFSLANRQESLVVDN